MDGTAPQHIESYYATSAGPIRSWPQLDRDERCEVAVIGGGLTGVSTALNLVESGVDVVLLEAERVGWGASGRNGGQAQTGFGGEIEDLEKLVDSETARALWNMTVRGLDIITERCRRHRIDCDLKQGYLLAAAKARNMAAHAEWVERAARVYGYTQFQLLDRDAVRREVASERYHGGILDTGSLHLHPLKYCLGLAEAAQAAGARLYEASRVERVTCDSIPTIHLAQGVIRADRLVLACNAFPAPDAKEIGRRIIPVGTFICATEPMDESRAQTLIPHDIAVCDDRHVLDYFRLSADRRMLFGGRESVRNGAPANLEQSIRRRMLRVFPQLGDVAIDAVWGGQIALTRNRFPDIGRLGPDIYYAHGFSGHGLALSGVVGEILAAAIKGDQRGLDVFQRIPHRAFPGGSALRTPLAWLGLFWLKVKDLL